MRKPVPDRIAYLFAALLAVFVVTATIAREAPNHPHIDIHEPREAP